MKSDKPDKSYSLATLGPENTFSSLAAKKYMPKGKIWHAKSITEVFDLVKKGTIKKGIVPLENKLTGSVAETSDNLFESNLKIQEALDFPIHHFLVALDKIPKNKIKTIYSHPQPIRQSRKYIRKHFPKANLISLSSTAAALDKVVSENLREAAVICSKEAAKALRITILSKNIEDYPFNSTRFAVIGKKELPFKKGKKYLTSIVFYFKKDAPGSLYQVLGEFAAAKVNMTKIESSANPAVPGGYVFFIDFEGSIQNPNVKKMLPKIRKHVATLKVLGSYKRLSH